MVSLDAPAPGTFGLRFAENKKVIHLLVARESASGALEFMKHRLEADDVRGLAITVLAQARKHQGVCKLPLLRRHFFNRESFALLGDVMPVQPLVGLKLEARLRLLLRL